MKIAIITEGFRPYVGGVETRYTELADRLARENKVSVYTTMKDEDAGVKLPEKEQVEGLTIHRIPQRGEYFLADGTRPARGITDFLLKTLTRMKGGDFDAVICSEWPLAHIPPIAALRSSLCVVDWHEVWGKYYLGFGAKGYIGYLLERAVARTLGLRHTAVSNFTKSRLTSLLGVPSPAITVIPSGVDFHAFDALSAKRKWGHLIYFGRFVTHKHIEWLIEAFERLTNSKLELSLRIAGDGPLRENLKKRIRGTKEADLLDPLPKKELVRELKTAWIAVIPSIREGQGISYLEAMAAGTPVVAVDSPLSAAKELIENGRNGLLVQPSPYGLVQGITSLLKDEDLWSRISEEGCRTARGYSWDESATRFGSLLEDGIGGKT